MPNLCNGLIPKLLLFAGAGACVCGCAGQARKTATAPGENISEAHLRHVSVSLVGGSYVFFDHDTGKLWEYDDVTNRARLIGQLQSFDKPLVTPSIPVKTESGFDKGLVKMLNAMPKNLWPSQDETSLERDTRNDWLEGADRNGTFTGEISDVSSQPPSDVQNPGLFSPGLFTEASGKTDAFVTLTGKNVAIFGRNWTYSVTASFDSPGPSGMIALKKGQTLTISGSVKTAMLYPHFTNGGAYSSIVVYLEHATVKPKNAAVAGGR